MKASEILSYAINSLEEKNIKEAKNNALILLGHVLNKPYLNLLATDCELTSMQREQFLKLLALKLSYEPIEYIIGYKEFCNISLQVGKGVLIPRFETELILDLVKELYPNCKSVLDICTGSGAILLALKNNIESIQRAIGIDISQEALKYAKLNKQQLKLKVDFLQLSIKDLASLDSKFDIITANPPYITSDEYNNLARDVKEFEPKLALEAGDEGLDCILPIIEHSYFLMNEGAYLIIEIGAYQKQAILNHEATFAKYSLFFFRQDLSSKERFFILKK